MRVLVNEQVNTTAHTSNVILDLESSVGMRPSMEHHEATLAVGSKRYQNFPIEDGMVSSTKYPKLEPEKSHERKEAQSVSSSSDEYCDESSDAENRNQEDVHSAQNLCSHFLDGKLRLQSEHPTVEMDSDVDSVAISPRRDIMTTGFISRMERNEDNDTINKLILVPTAMRIQNHLTHTSQLSSNNELENNNVNDAANLETTIKQSNSQLYQSSDENTNGPVNVISIPESSSLAYSQEEYFHQGSEQAQDNNEEAISQSDTAGCLYTVTTQSLRPSNLKIENSSSQDQSSQSSRDTYPDQIDEQSNGNQFYALMHRNQAIDNQVPSTSGFEENSYEMSRAGSVSDLNLAHLVLSLKSDIQKLTEKVERQEGILDAVIHANEVNLSPLFTQSFQEKHNLTIPFTKLEHFLKFNEDLAKDKKLCYEFTTSLIGYIDKQVTFAKNILNMVKQYMSKDLAILFNASKQTPNKMVLKDTIFCKCLLQATKITLQKDKLPLEHEKIFMKNLGHVISGARSWHNHTEE